MSRKLTTEEFIAKAKLIHGSKYGYSLVEYINNHTKIKIICRIDGIFEQQPNNHLQGKGCPKCVGRNVTTEEFINMAKNVHGNKYGYLPTKYMGSKLKVKIICQIHGEFEQIPDSHLRGCGCPKCDGKNITTEEFINMAKKVHGNKYGYLLTEYINNRTRIKIICLIHGMFQQRPSDHLVGCGCPKCGFKQRNFLKTKTTSWFIKKANIIHNNKYGYSLSEYISSRKKIKIVCFKHGTFQQTPNQHFRGTRTVR